MEKKACPCERLRRCEQGWRAFPCVGSMENKQTTETKALRPEVYDGLVSSILPFDTLIIPFPDESQKEAYIHVENSPVTIDELKRWNKKLDRTSDCMTVPIIRTCSHDLQNAIAHNHGLSHGVHVKTERCNERNYCPRCAHLSASKRAHEQYEIIDDEVAKRINFPVMVNHIVLTIPPDKASMSPAELHKLTKHLVKNIQGDTITRKAYNRIYKQMTNHLKNKRVSEAAYNKVIATAKQQLEAGLVIRAYATAIQTYSSSNPFDDHLHVHIFLLNVGYRPSSTDNNKSLDDGHFVKLPHFLDVDMLRVQWNKSLGRTATSPIDIQTSYADFHVQKGRIIHWLTYIYRYPSWDMFKFIIRSSVILASPDRPARSPDPDTAANEADIMFNHDTSMIVQRLYEINEQAQKVTWSGWMAPTNRKKFTLKLGHFKSLAYRREVNAELARTCGYVDHKGVRCNAPLVRLKVDHWNDYRKGLRRLADIELETERRAYDY